MTKKQSAPTAAEALKEAHDTIKWMWDNMSVDNKDQQNDSHDRPANALHVIELAQGVWQYPSDAVEFAKWIGDEGYEYTTTGEWIKPGGNTGRIITTAELYKLFNPSGAAPEKYDVETGYKKGLQGWTAFFIIGVQTFTLGDLHTEERAIWYKDMLDKAFANLSGTSSRHQGNAEPEKKYPIGGYAPGNYQCICATCNKAFLGDKRAVQCESCATAAQSDPFIEKHLAKIKELQTHYAKVHAPQPVGPVLTKELFNELIIAGRDMENRDRMGNVYLAPDDYYKQICERTPITEIKQ